MGVTGGGAEVAKLVMGDELAVAAPLGSEAERGGRALGVRRVSALRAGVLMVGEPAADVGAACPTDEVAVAALVEAADAGEPEDRSAQALEAPNAITHSTIIFVRSMPDSFLTRSCLECEALVRWQWPGRTETTSAA
ncbi:MAG: hypothetical protein M3Y35_18700 [Actinomycetota bacterium]|nr:hypothetical protein [Actinomycetota bacterium]